ncbi:MAG: SH3 domain-containing protein [Spirochaetaceae bacterium]|nr:SH3 domain-containing protein [Spirochaetaceae bacterium]
MKKIVLILLLCMCFLGCTKKAQEETQSVEETLTLAEAEQVPESNILPAATETEQESKTENLERFTELAKEKLQFTSEQTGLYAVTSFEGLKVRSTPSLEGKKLGLLEYQETVKCLSVENEKITLDGITSNWYKIKSIESGLEGYVFGGYLRQLHRIKYTVEDMEPFAIDSEKILSMIDGDSGIETEWNLEDGIYLPAQLIIQSQNAGGLGYYLDKETCGIVIKNSKLYYFYSFNEGDIIIVSEHYGTSVDSWYKPEVSENAVKEKEFIVYLNERSGGGKCHAVNYDGKNLGITFYANSFALTARTTYILEKVSNDNPAAIKVKYDYSFPYFANITNINAYSSLKNTSEYDLTIVGNQRKIPEDGVWGPLSDEGEKSIVELTDYILSGDTGFYEGIYKGQQIYIKESDLNYPLYISKKFLEEAVCFENGL